MLNNQKIDNLLFYVLRIKEDSIKNNLKFSIYYENLKKEFNFYELNKEINENYITRIFYFDRIKGKKSFLLKIGSIIATIDYNEDLKFQYKNYPKDYSLIEMSILEKFKSYKKFVEKSCFSDLENIFYNDSIIFCKNHH